MKTRITALIIGMVLVAGPILMAAVWPGPTALAAELPDMCNGRTDPNLVVIAHANGRPNSVPKYILNVSTDASGKPTGSLILDRGSDRLLVTDWCRVWQHLPGQPSGGHCETYPEGATTAHAVGLGKLSDGQIVIVRTDVRETTEGMFFRVRYRSPGDHETAVAMEGDDCEDPSWTRVPTEGWYPLDQMRVQVETAQP